MGFVESSPRPTGNGARLRKRELLAVVLAILIGLAVSIWLTVEPPLEEPAHPSYLRGD